MSRRLCTFLGLPVVETKRSSFESVWSELQRAELLLQSRGSIKLGCPFVAFIESCTKIEIAQEEGGCACAHVERSVLRDRRECALR